MSRFVFFDAIKPLRHLGARGFFVFGNPLLLFPLVGAGDAGKKKNRQKLDRFQRFSLVQNGGRSRTRIYDLHDVNVAL